MASESKPLINSLEVIISEPVIEEKVLSAFVASSTDFTPSYRKQNTEANWLYRRRMAEHHAEHEGYSYKYNIRYKRLKEIL